MIIVCITVNNRFVENKRICNWKKLECNYESLGARRRHDGKPSFFGWARDETNFIFFLFTFAILLAFDVNDKNLILADLSFLFCTENLFLNDELWRLLKWIKNRCW